MDFRPDNVADVLGIILGLILLVMSHRFYMRMRTAGADAWAQAGKMIFYAALLFTAGMFFTLLTIFFSSDAVREFLNLVGNGMWVISAYFAYRMIFTLVKIMEVVFGG